MELNKDIVTREDVIMLVNTFYDAVRNDDVIGPIFTNKIQDRWPQHLAKMYDFWSTILLDEKSYHGAPFAPHARLPISSDHFDRWLSIFYAILDSLFKGPKADEAKWRSYKMATMFNSKIEYFRNNPDTLPIV